jgi:hypothetical protein
MADQEEPIKPAWQPLTFGGVARFAAASLGRLLLLQTVVAGLVALTIAAFLSGILLTSIREAINRLPPDSKITQGELRWGGAGAAHLIENKFLLISVNPEDGSLREGAADLHIELQKTNIKLASLFGFLQVSYPRGYTVELNRTELVPLWGAWSPAILAIGSLGTVLFLFLSWTVLALVYAMLPRAIAFYLDRPLAFFGAWKLCSAALMPGALLMTIALFLYGAQRLTLVTLLAITAAHIPLGWIYVIGAPFFLPREKTEAANPFRSEGNEEDSPEDENPFRG